MLVRVLAAALTFCAFVSNVADAAPLAGLEGQQYDAVRNRLIRAGYRIVRFQRGPLFEPCPDYPSECERYPEAINCSGTGLAFCQFAFFDPAHRRYVVVTTHGEERRVVDSIATASRRERSGWPPAVR
jgi:hypothetical protein